MKLRAKERLLSLLIAVLFVSALFAGAFVASNQSAASPLVTQSVQGGNVTVGSGYSLSYWNLGNGTQIMQGNLTVKSGGVVRLYNETLMFNEFAAANNYQGYEAAPIYHITVEDGGKMILYHSAVTTNLKLINDIPVLGVYEQHGGSISMYSGSSFRFPGQFVVYNSNLTMVNSSITGFSPSDFSTNFINETVFPPGIFANPPVIAFYGSNVLVEGSSIYIFQNNTQGKLNETSVYTEHYPFASDTQEKNSVSYTVEALPSSVYHRAPLADTTRNQNLNNLTANDQENYTVQAGQRLSVTNFTTGGILQPLQSVALHVLYETQGAVSGTINWAYGNTTNPVQTVSVVNTAQYYYPSPNNYYESTVYLPASLMPFSVNDLSRILVWLNDSAGTVYVNKLWFTMQFSMPAYKNITVGGSTSFTAVDSFIGVNFTPSPELHTGLFVSDTAHAYLYDVRVNTTSPSGSEYSTPLFGMMSSMDAKPLTLGPLNTHVSTDHLSYLDSDTPDYYNITPSGTLQTYGMNVSSNVTLNTILYSAELSIMSPSSLNTEVFVGEEGQPVSSYVSTGIYLNGSANDHNYHSNLYALGFTNLSDISHLVVYIHNGAGASVYVRDINIQLGILPQIYLYRIANVTVYSSQNLPVGGSTLSFRYTGTTPGQGSAGSSAGYYVGPDNNYASTPPQTVLSFFGRTSSNYNVTNYFGNAVVPLMSDVIDHSTYPDSMFVGNYSVSALYNGSSYGGYFSFLPYPQISVNDTFVNYTVNINATLPLPRILVGKPLISPSFIYDNQSGTITFNVTDDGSTGVNALPINITDTANGKLIAYHNFTVSIGPHSTVSVGTDWLFNTSGYNTVSVVANQYRTVPESNYGGDINSTLFYVEPNLPELVILSSGITFNPSPAYSGKNVKITADIENLQGRAGANNITVAFYYGNPDSGGTLIADGSVSVSAGGSNSTSISWTPNTIGTVPIYVYIDPLHNIQQYSTAGNLNYSVLTIYLSVGQQDLVVDNSNSNASSPFTIDAPINVSSNIVVTQSGYLDVNSGSINFIETYSGEYAFLINESSRAMLYDAYISSNMQLNIFVYGSSTFEIINSTIGQNVNIITGGSASIVIRGSSIEGNLTTAAFSSARIASYNTSFSSPLSFGYSEYALLFNVSSPSVSAQSQATVSIYRWLWISVYGPSETTISGAAVTLYTFSNLSNPSGMPYETVISSQNGVALFAALSDVINSTSDTYHGNYVVNTTYTDAGIWYAPEVIVSVPHYSVPLLHQNANVSTHLVIRLPDLALEAGSLNVLTSPIIEDSQANLTALVYNIGYAPQTENFTVEFLLPGMAAVNVTTSLSTPLMVGQAIPIQTVWNVPMSYGNMTLSAIVNPLRTDAEISYANSETSVSVNVLSLPELQPLEMNVTGLLEEGSQVTFNVALHNYGQTHARYVPLIIYSGSSPENMTNVSANMTVRNIGPGATTIVHVNWTVPSLPFGVRTETLYFTAIINPYKSIKEMSYAYDMLAQPIELNVTLAQVNANVVLSANSVKSGSVVIITISVSSKISGKPIAGYPVTVDLYNFRGQPVSGVTFSGTTASNGMLIARMPIPQNVPAGAYHFMIYSQGNFISVSSSFNIAPRTSPTVLPISYWLIAAIAAVAAFAGFSLYLYRYGLARVVECGNCGAFIPESSKKCPHCGVEFETGTAKCSNCSSWIPASSRECPVCGVKFVDEGEGEPEDEQSARMRKQYSEFTEKFRAQAKVELGSKYSDKSFLSWWKKQPTYMTFEEWLSKQQEMNRARMIKCPECGEPNPASASECVKCGTTLQTSQAESKPPVSPPQQREEAAPKPSAAEPKRIVIPKKVVRKIEEKPQEQKQPERTETNNQSQ